MQPGVPPGVPQQLGGMGPQLGGLQPGMGQQMPPGKPPYEPGEIEPLAPLAIPMPVSAAGMPGAESIAHLAPPHATQPGTLQGAQPPVVAALQAKYRPGRAASARSALAGGRAASIRARSQAATGPTAGMMRPVSEGGRPESGRRVGFEDERSGERPPGSGRHPRGAAQHTARLNRQQAAARKPPASRAPAARGSTPQEQRLTSQLERREAEVRELGSRLQQREAEIEQLRGSTPGGYYPPPTGWFPQPPPQQQPWPPQPPPPQQQQPWPPQPQPPPPQQPWQPQPQPPPQQQWQQQPQWQPQWQQQWQQQQPPQPLPPQPPPQQQQQPPPQQQQGAPPTAQNLSGLAVVAAPVVPALPVVSMASDVTTGFGAGADRFLSAAKACLRSDNSRDGKLDAKCVLRLCARYKINVPADMAETARQKGVISYVNFVDKLRERNT